MKKRLFSILLAGCLIASTTACGGSNTTSGDANTDQQDSGTNAVIETQTMDFDPDERVASSTNDGLAKFEEPIDVTAMTWISADAASTSYEDSQWTKMLSEKFNINIEYTTLAVVGDQYDQQVALMLSSGNMPDLVNLSLTQMTQAQQAGLLQDVTGAYYDYVSDQAYEAMTADGDNPFKAATFNGALYGVPWVDPSLETCHALFYNQAWLNELNLDAPTDWESFEAMIYAFAETDFDGDGSTTNNYGIGLTQNIWDTGFEATSIANAMGAYPNAWVVSDEGSVIYGSVQPEMKEVLTKLNQYYQDGLIDPEFINKTFDNESELVATSRLGAMFGIQWSGLMGSCMQTYYQNSENPSEESWQVTAIPSYNGETVSPIIYDNSSTWLCVREGFEHPEIVSTIVNYMHYMGIGPQGDGTETRSDLAIDYATWTDMWNNDSYRIYNPGTEHGNITRWEHWTEALAAGDDADTTWIDNNYLAMDQYYKMKDYQAMGIDMVGQTNDTLGVTYQMSDASWQFTYALCGQTFMYAKDCQEADNLVYDVQGSFVSTSMVEKQAALDDYELQTFTKMITGELSVDEFDNFVETWKSMGGEAITSEMNNYYNSKNVK